MNNRKILVFEDSNILANHLVKQWKELAEESVALRNRFNVALSGGRTPVEFYSRLSSLEDFDLWQHTHIYLADERFVELDNVDSNYRMIKENLLNYINIPPDNIHPVPFEGENAAIAAELYKNVLSETLSFEINNLPCFDLMMLGIGEDGHTASLFPGVEDIANPQRITIPVSLNHLKHDRISLSLSVINNSRNVVFLVQGDKKAAIVKDIIENHADCPATQVGPIEGKLFFLLDRKAAGQLTIQDNFTNQDDAILINE